MGESILIASGKGGVGKTTLCAYLGRALAANGLQVCLVDGDMRMGNLDLAMRCEDKVIHGVEEVLSGLCRLRSALLPDHRVPSLYALYAKNSVPFPEQALDALLTEMRRLFAYVLLDAPAGTEEGFVRLTRVADAALLVTTPEIYAVRDAERTARALTALHTPIRGLAINRLSCDKPGQDGALEIARLLRLPLLGVVPESDRLRFAQPWEERERLAFTLLALRLTGADAPLFDLSRAHSPFYRTAIRRNYHAPDPRT